MIPPNLVRRSKHAAPDPQWCTSHLKTNKPSALTLWSIRIAAAQRGATFRIKRAYQQFEVDSEGRTCCA